MPKKYEKVAPENRKKPGRKEDSIPNEIIQQVVEMKAAGNSLTKISNETGLSLFIIRRILRDSESID